MYLKTFYQINSQTCGMGALKSFMYYHSKGKIKNIKEDVFHQAYSLKELKDIAFTNGLITYGIELDSKDIENIPNYSLVLLNYNNYRHYVFYLYTKKNKVFMIDPSMGKVICCKDDFLKEIDNYALIYESSNDVKKHKNKVDKISLFLLIFELLQSIPLLFLFTTFYYTNYISFYAISFYWAIFALKRFILLKFMNKFDKTIESKIKENNIDSEELILKLYKYKEYKFTNISNIYNYILIRFIFIVFTLLLPYGYILTIAYLLIMIIEYIFYKKSNNKLLDLKRFDKQNISIYEKYKNMNEVTNKFIFRSEVIKIISILFFFSQLLIYYKLSNSITLITGLLVTSIYLIFNNNLYLINEKNKQYKIGKTIYESLK